MRIHPILLSLLMTAAAAPAFALEPAPAPAEHDGARAASVADTDRERERDTVDRHCLRETGTRIRVREGQRRCTAFAGRVWTRDDLDRTGQTDIGDALRMLDVSIR